LQEKQCAALLFLLVPIPPDIELSDKERWKEKFQSPLVGNDLCIELASIQRLWASRDLFTDFYNEEFSVEKGYRDGFQGLWVMAQARYCSTKYMDEDCPWESYSTCFTITELYDNAVVADRISIYGHICKLPYQLLSNRLDSPEFSYSTCVLAMLMANCATRAQRRGTIDFLWSEAWQKTPPENEDGNTLNNFLVARVFKRVGDNDGDDGDTKVLHDPERLRSRIITANAPELELMHVLLDEA
jgi:hypothetical protein